MARKLGKSSVELRKPRLKPEELGPEHVVTCTRRGKTCFGKGLYLQVGKSGGRSWIFRFRRRIEGRRQPKGTWMGLGAVADVPLDEARAIAHRLRRQRRVDRIDPMEARRAERDAQRKRELDDITFKAAATRFLDLHEATWRNDKHRAQWRATLADYAYPTLGDRPVRVIDDALINHALADIWQTIPETASRTRQRILRVTKWVKDGMRLPTPSKAKRVKHHAALRYADLPAFMAELRQRPGQSARALEFLILCAARTGEVIGARWAEIDHERKLWAIPGPRMKAGKPHTVPLSDAALAILDAQPVEDGNPFVFVSAAKPGHGLSNMAMLELMKDMRPGFVPHGFRSSFTDWASECTAYPDIVRQMALAHAIGDKVEAAYRRGDLLAKRRKLMADWAKYCAQPPISDKSNVTPLRQPGQ